MTETPVDYRQALHFYQQQARNPTQDWEAFCQMLFRLAYQVPALYGSAFAQWQAADHKVVTTDLDSAPVGAGLCTKGSNPAGHIFDAAYPFRSGLSGAWSNDLVVTGKVNKVHRNAPMIHWGHSPLGYVLEVNEYELDLTHGKPPKPKQNKRYLAVKVAITKMERSLETAKRQKDAHDVRLLTKEIKDLKVLYSRLRHS